MIKLVDILNEIVPPKNTWFPLSKVEVKDVEKEILDLIIMLIVQLGAILIINQLMI